MNYYLCTTKNKVINSKNTYQIFKELTKSGLSLSVVFSSLAGYLLGITSISAFDFITFLYLFLGGYAMVGASNVFNQVIEKDLDKLMTRTQLRPLPNGDVTQNQALVLGFGLSIFGLSTFDCRLFDYRLFDYQLFNYQLLDYRLFNYRLFSL